MYFLVNIYPRYPPVGRSNFKLCRCIGQVMKKVLRNISSERDPKININGHIMYFLVTASPPKPLDVATSNIAAAYIS